MRQDLYQQTGSVQTASVSKTTYFYQVARKHWLCGASVFIDADPGYLTTAESWGFLVGACGPRPSRAWPSQLRQAESGRLSLCPFFFFTGNTELLHFWTDMVFIRKPNTHLHIEADANSRDWTLVFSEQCAETKPSCQGSYLRVEQLLYRSIED